MSLRSTGGPAPIMVAPMTDGLHLYSIMGLMDDPPHCLWEWGRAGDQPKARLLARLRLPEALTNRDTCMPARILL
jgi:hypothetical protein